MSPLAGIRIVRSPLAIHYRQWCEVVAWPIRKRRRGYRVVRREEKKPGAYQGADGTVYMHPDIYAQLPKASQP